MFYSLRLVIQCKCVLAYTLHIFNPYCKKCGIEMHFNYRDDAKHYLQKNLEYQIDFLNDCRKLQRIKFWRWYKQHMFMQARKHFLSFINKISRSASKSTKKHIFYILPKKNKEVWKPNQIIFLIFWRRCKIIQIHISKGNENSVSQQYFYYYIS